MNSVDAAGLGIGDEHPPRIMGVLNVSEESPYDPSVYDDPGEAAQYVDEELIGEGADIVDIGLESANKRFDVLSAEEELERLHIALETIESVSGDAIFSIETRYHEVAEEALSQGFDMVNDIAGFADPDMPTVCVEYDAAVAKMASPPDLERPGAVEETDWAARKSPDWATQADYVDQVYEALKQNGLTDKTIIDPAFGGWSEAQTLADDQETFRRLREFRALGQPMLVSINRKNFLGSIADRETEERLPVSLAATSMAVERGAHVIRTHDVAETRDAALIGSAFSERASVSTGSVTVSRLDTHTSRTFERQLRERGVDPELVGTVQPQVLEFTGLSSSQFDELTAAVETVRGEVTATGCQDDSGSGNSPDGDGVGNGSGGNISVQRTVDEETILLGSTDSISAVSARLAASDGEIEPIGDELDNLLQ
ncbi:dihydropteroate synthase [Natrialba magadii ATCC 43099]|uniref:dihydropteroate synthase n=1 Tax=Natrialba magadii (strain ATCC 43099 / DSM 3394 / CCM 3739 / CIP 104546 / IAM 13178 / JCM 8861 / NBRC 102185 / NCIMB 2190 / MS3) TaxID=547559 RepID=D3SVN3_NATMM|nr:dihydropteroate synthase [Natrialba magadii]ADD03602.1 dihydropteroate synthase [Natrialba magadii ATCC 43099]ELY29063.1 dihydropteroate synthase [Natrialba magadii ATCC 43099]